MLLPQPGRPRTELLPFPGSGNSWVRHIIETLTGYRTNSVYHCNVQNYPPEVAADCNKWNVSIVTKSHVFNCVADWERAIVLLRNPLHAIRAEYQRANTWNQTAVISKQQWNWEDWYKKLDRKCRQWVEGHAAVLGSSSSRGCAATKKRTTHVYFFEDLKTAAGVLNAKFLDQLLSILDIKEQHSYQQCTIAYDPEGEFKRSYPTDPQHPAVQVLQDPRTLQIVQQAGCMDAYNSFRAAYPRLEQATS